VGSEEERSSKRSVQRRIRDDRPSRPSRTRDQDSRPSYRDRDDRPSRPPKPLMVPSDATSASNLPPGGIWTREDPAMKSVEVLAAASRSKKRLKLPEDVQRELTRLLSGYQLRVSSIALLEAINAYDRERYYEAIKLLEVVVKHAPTSTSALELLGLSYYRVGKWLKAIEVLEDFHELSGSNDQDPVLCDCFRALRRWNEVDKIWKRLKEASPSREVVAEGRIVYASSLAERDRLEQGVALLENAIKGDKHADLVVVRQLYALGRLYEDSGNVSKAKLIYKDIVAYDKSLYDAAERVLALS
jgi:tetratricopeptide (TPR) repeat protein